MRTRDATPADADAVRAVHSRSIEELGPRAYSQKQVAVWAEGCESADYVSAIEADEFEFVVAEIDGNVEAFGSLKLLPPDGYQAAVDAEVTGVYVHPSAVRQGVGTDVYSELERRARTHNVQTLGLSTSLNAVQFYEAHGYVRVREYLHEFSGRESTGVTGTVVEMKKEL